MKIKDWLADASPNGKQEKMIRNILRDKHNLILTHDIPDNPLEIKYKNLCLSFIIDHQIGNEKIPISAECDLNEDFEIISFEIFGRLKPKYDISSIKNHIMAKAKNILDALDDTYHEVINWKINNLDLKDEWRN